MIIPRFSIVSKYILENYPSEIRIADVGSGKNQRLTKKLLNKYRIVPFDYYIYRNGSPAEFRERHGKDFDLLVGIWACFLDELIIKSAAKYKIDFILFPCGCHNNCGSYVKRIRRTIQLAKKFGFKIKVKRFRFSTPNMRRKASWVLIHGKYEEK